MEAFGGRRPWFGGEYEEHEARFGGDRELFVGEGELTDDGVVEPLGAGAVGSDVVVGPEPAEDFALGGSSPTRSCSPRSCGSRPASVRMTPTHIWANRSQSG